MEEPRKLTVADLLPFVEKLDKEYQSKQKRHIVLYTWEAGMREFDEAVKKSVREGTWKN